MSNQDPSSFYSPHEHHRHKAKYIRDAVSVGIGAEHILAQVNGQSGHLDFVQVVLEDEDDLYLEIQIDGQKIFDFSHTQIEDDGEGKLSIPLLYGIAAPFGVTRTAASYYGIMWNGGLHGVGFDRQMIISIQNRGTAAYKIQGAYVLYAIDPIRRRQP